MPGPGFLHVNVRCADLEQTRQFYERFTGLKVGDRPPFSSRGYWLYAGAVPVVHLVERRPAEPEVHGSGAIDRVAFEGTDLDGMRRTLRNPALPTARAGCQAVEPFSSSSAIRTGSSSRSHSRRSLVSEVRQS
jgi:catechol 2,3-dioxygenase-like lactoylglutathione lyase family enzyme